MSSGTPGRKQFGCRPADLRHPHDFLALLVRARGESRKSEHRRTRSFRFRRIRYSGPKDGAAANARDPGALGARRALSPLLDLHRGATAIGLGLARHLGHGPSLAILDGDPLL